MRCAGVWLSTLLNVLSTLLKVLSTLKNVLSTVCPCFVHATVSFKNRLNNQQTTRDQTLWSYGQEVEKHARACEGPAKLTQHGDAPLAGSFIITFQTRVCLQVSLRPTLQH